MNQTYSDSRNEISNAVAVNDGLERLQFEFVLVADPTNFPSIYLLTYDDPPSNHRICFLAFRGKIPFSFSTNNGVVHAARLMIKLKSDTIIIWSATLSAPSQSLHRIYLWVEHT